MSELAIVESRADRASVHVCDQLRALADWTEREEDSRPDEAGGGTYYSTEGAELRTFEELHIELERPADAFDCDPDLLVFASRHSGETGPLLTGHFTGNFGPAEYGGEDHAVAEAAPNALARLLEAFDEYAPEGYDVGMECTHHGPTDVGCPSLFAELGSGDEQWDDPAGAEAVARGILDLRDAKPHRERQVVGFGGNHYAPRFERVVRKTPWAVGHIASDWALEELGHPTAHRDVLEAAFEESDAEIALLDGEWPVLEEALEDLGYRIVGETWLREVGNRPLGLVDAIESELGHIENGIRFGDREADSFTVVDLPPALVDTAEGIDPDRVRNIVDSHTVAYETENGGTRVGERVAVPDLDPDARRTIIEEVAAVLEEKYETVRLEEDAIVAEEEGFDPELAHEAGVPEGPKFGALANGEAVTVDGETIKPERVRTERTRRFEI
ncbi:D-aminoacyl-tRNA deacylase [Halopiger xanaduensis]|uniref:D-aminoacyl-tRNA deacylase n=1 Tax=Halopiger xanaduensis (strain DSM 18323 / JCM 14033 / SH-6) TaxID=797210 RepID=F8D3R7_HALXS|nr:D-aminoacyl-tRNA deacylase [Halopiger xanaduensis]AEH38570.1 D-tyrosyl-tRNA(Tyr) deacylase [Halopiger xanaduensis SH-6]